MANTKMEISPKWQKVKKEELEKDKIERPSLTYWQDAWRRLKKNKLSMVGLSLIIIIALTAIFAPMISKYSYEDQRLEFVNMPPKFEVYKIDDNNYFHLTNEYKLILVSGEGELIDILKEVEINPIKAYKRYELNENEIILDYSFAKKTARSKDPNAKKFELRLNGEEMTINKTMRNKSYILGSDHLGRDLFIRIVFGARISLFVAFVATMVNFFIGVFYGGISGYIGGKVDNVMMRIVDIISTVPLLLIVILLSVYLGNGIKTIIIAFGLVYWVRMARLVRGQVLSLKEQEFVLAAKTVGASTWRILAKHLIPNAMGPIIVSMTMMIPAAIFTEAFLSFIGLGVSAPQASWGTIANEALKSLWTNPYQLIYPSIAICITILAFNFLGDGLRDALDPRLRK
ncbi:ABC transporter permease [Oceanirhabdus sp. W0125-5]|uniref:ABC transporter permease n=1 Tax=Oceanirhabdus sp. W0125-5 TaxID=2999116 RepID=UPI0022F2A86E|nr:ABC transporter permease [Oceanirhabdus sp. W0125-5]WBW99545.1 ABC transporter permease [Oceanirhabdus sp. W0125-5]